MRRKKGMLSRIEFGSLKVWPTEHGAAFTVEPRQPTTVLPIPRLCEVGGQRCHFHRFIEEDKAYLKINSFCHRSDAEKLLDDYTERGLIAPGAELQIARTCSALVEFPNGSVRRVDPESVRFLDRKEAKQ